MFVVCSQNSMESWEDKTIHFEMESRQCVAVNTSISIGGRAKDVGRTKFCAKIIEIDCYR